MARHAINVKHVTDDILEFFGFRLVWQENGFKIYRDKYQDDHIVEESYPYLFVDSKSDAEALRSSEVIQVDDDD